MSTFALPPDLEEYVAAKVQGDEYLCASEVIVHGLYLLQDQDILRQIKLERLRKEIAVGLRPQAEEKLRRWMWKILSHRVGSDWRQAMDDFVNRWNGIKDEMFSCVEDPLKSKWWNKAWEIMLDPKFGPVVASDMPEVEVALLLIELRNIHTGYEFMYWQYDYEPTWLDYWTATGLPRKKLISYLRSTGFLTDGKVSEDEDRGAVPDAMHTYCWGKRQVIYDALIRHFGDETSLGMYMLGGKTHRNKDADQRIFDYACSQFDF